MSNITPSDPRPTPRPPHAKHPPRRSLWARLLLWLVGLTVASAVIIALVASYALLVAAPRLPSLDAVTDYRPKVPMRIFTADHLLIGEFGEERRTVVRFDDIPEVMKKAVLAIEDDRFYQHGGIDYVGILRAGLANITKGGNAQGASTITMQVARNFFLSSEKTYTRKIYEILLSYKIENALSKDQILELYMNQIYLGQRAYGFAAAAQVYFGKGLRDVTLAQAAMLAGLPKAPSAYNPIANPQRAQIRQHYILKRMLELGYIDQTQYTQALAEDIQLRTPGQDKPKEFSVHAEHVAEMARQMMVAQYGDDAYTRGLNVLTTIDSGNQEAAYQAVRAGVVGYDKRHGYRGPEARIVLPGDAQAREVAIEQLLQKHPDDGDIVAAVVLSITSAATAGRAGTRRAAQTAVTDGTDGGMEVVAARADGERVIIRGAGLRFAAAWLPPYAKDKTPIQPGSVIRVVAIADDTAKAADRSTRRPIPAVATAVNRTTSDGAGAGAVKAWQITQLPQVEGALVAVTPQDGAITALVGGFDFNKNKFNHVTQAWRQPGSAFKPFIYSASLEKGLAPATLIDDAPIFFSATETGGQAWAPKNYGGKFSGPTTMRVALMKSKNLVTIRIMQYIGAKYAQGYVTRFGFDADKQPPYLPMALGAGQVTPLQMAGGYAVFANGGYRVNPYLIAEVTDASGTVISHAAPLVAGANAPRVISPRNDYVMYSLLHDVASRGSGARSNVLKRGDLAGKTGTTNDSRDAWFAGFQRSTVAISWIGYDQPRSLGGRETGSGLALPVWIDYMAHALKGVPEYTTPMPEGVTTIDGEVYFSDMTPGAGFVPAVGLPDPGSAPVTIDDHERQQVLDMFSTSGDGGTSD